MSKIPDEIETKGRWYEALGGIGLEILRHDAAGRWRCVGYIQKNNGKWDIWVNPNQDEGYTLDSCDTLDAAKSEFLRRMNVSVVES